MISAGRQYDRWAKVYDAVWRRYAERTLDALLARADLGAGDRVLDVGCGTGILERKLVQQDPERTVVGVDASPRMIERARAKMEASPNLSFVQAGAHELPFPDESFDVVLSASTFHYLKDAGASLREMRRVLRRSGMLNVLDWSLDFKVMRLREAVLRKVDPAHVRTYSSDEVYELFRTAGLTVDRLETFRSGTYGLFFVAARRE